MFKVSDKQCNECLFSDQKIVSDKRKTAILKDCLKRDAHFICHKATLVGQDVCCRGFYEKLGYRIGLARAAMILKFVKFVDVERLKRDG